MLFGEKVTQRMAIAGSILGYDHAGIDGGKIKGFPLRGRDVFGSLVPDSYKGMHNIPDGGQGKHVREGGGKVVKVAFHGVGHGIECCGDREMVGEAVCIAGVPERECGKALGCADALFVARDEIIGDDGILGHLAACAGCRSDERYRQSGIFPASGIETGAVEAGVGRQHGYGLGGIERRAPTDT